MFFELKPILRKSIFFMRYVCKPTDFYNHKFRKTTANFSTRKHTFFNHNPLKCTKLVSITQVKDTTLINGKVGYCSSKNSRNESVDSVIRHLFHPDCENALNGQILAELNSSYAYLALSTYFGRPEVALPGCQGYFLVLHKEELTHAYRLIKYQNIRGGRVKFCPLTTIENMKWNVKKALEVSLELEKLIKEKLIHVHDVASKHHDLNLMDMIVTHFISEQEQAICAIGRLLTRINNMSNGEMCNCSEFLFDREVHKAFVKHGSSNITELDADLSVYK